MHETRSLRKLCELLTAIETRPVIKICYYSDLRLPFPRSHNTNRQTNHNDGSSMVNDAVGRVYVSEIECNAADELLRSSVYYNNTGPTGCKKIVSPLRVAIGLVSFEHIS